MPTSPPSCQLKEFAPLEYDLNYDNYLRKYLGAFGLPVS